ncbi:uncharacterized protein [Gossypium hirsutum]|uniref:Uncharacterized protein LOC107948572 isoform X3 n=1 Tax=Gossypium hirsutum TaxID=3635 RepID=A0A1U8NL80_GOSHI|nr:uncharacterized protein LOC107948572 isoform X3 [Gossypium hirsutum]XP_016738660.1 uncharacterized protein LOC107948572 isoform X3 [Gossypium hirsutum]XP_016738661.1 uncharacterized protein LOC107948572 isoform X3 [Gossypium hirsutum]XP_040971466.1 uncharacterized protein LOC107948572 isoform X3 [Gossypium hirsutum]XP_040971467.1 uncharacterized protein LOC107948572 isoform X3 [Gossypium hirsutum]XP_040971468.1 uncharacterized protein LOC107948572 isoform X3 [Gossypium hirsutum]
MSELKQHGAARKFHAVDVIYSDRRKSKLLIVFDTSKLAVPEASLVYLSFRANSQAMVNSWGKPFYDAFSESKSVQLYEITRDLLFYCQLQLLRVREICKYILFNCSIQMLGLCLCILSYPFANLSFGACKI